MDYQIKCSFVITCYVYFKYTIEYLRVALKKTTIIVTAVNWKNGCACKNQLHP